MKNMLSATIVVHDESSPGKVRFLKYHNIPDREPQIQAFVKFAINKGVIEKTPAQWVNFYDQDGEKMYKFRRYCKLV